MCSWQLRIRFGLFCFRPRDLMTEGIFLREREGRSASKVIDGAIPVIVCGAADHRCRYVVRHYALRNARLLVRIYDWLACEAT